MKLRTRPWLGLIAAMLALVLVASACGNDSNENGNSANNGDSSQGSNGNSGSNGDNGDGSDEDPTAPVYGGSITVGLAAEVPTWTPGAGSMGSAGLSVALAIYDPLVQVNANGEFEGFLAEELEANDDVTEWTLKLREGITFADGTPLDAETVKWNFDILHFTEGTLTYGTLKTAGVTGIEVVGPLTVKYTLNAPNAAFPDLLRNAAGWPVSREAYEADPEGFGSSPVGTGPFVMKEWTRDDHSTVVRNENYWLKAPNGDQLPYLDQVTFRPIPDEDSRVQGLAAGDLQMMQSFRGSKVKEVLALADKGGYSSSLYVGSSFAASNLNTLVPPLDDVRIRQALAYSSDANAVQKVLGDDGLSDPAFGLFSKDSPWFSQKVNDAYPEAGGRDLEAARALVDEYKADPNRSDGKAVGSSINVEYICPTDPSQIQLSVLWQSLWGEVGVDLDVKQVEETVLVQRMVGSADQNPPFRGEYTISCTYAGGGFEDPLTRLRSYFGPVETTPGNITNYVDPEIDRLMEELASNTDFTKRYEVVEEIGMILAEQVPIIWGSPTPRVVGYVDNIHGLTDWVLPSGSPGNGTPEGHMRFHQVFVAK